MRKNKKKIAVSSIMFSGALVLSAGGAWAQSSVSEPPRAGQSGSAVGSGSSASGQMSQDQIKQIQQALKDKGHDPGPIDGNMNARTQQAIRDFQKSQKLTVTGTLDSSTASALGVTPPSSLGAERSSSGSSGSGLDSSGKGSSSGPSVTPGGANPGSAGSSGSSGSGSRSGDTAQDPK